MSSNLKVDIVKPTATNGSLSLKGDSGGSATSNGISVDSSGNTSITGTTTIDSLDVSAGTLTLANDQISGDKIEGGTIGSVAITTADINGGAIDGTTIGASSAAAGSFTSVDATSASLDGTVTINESGADVDFRVESDTNENALFVEGSSGNIGIGKNNPVNKLDIEHSNNLLLSLSRNNGAFNASLTFKTNTANNVEIDGGGASEFLRFFTGGSERMRIDSSGNVLVGRTNSGIADSDNGVLVAQNGYFAINTSSSISDTLNYYNHTAGAYRFYVSNGGVIHATNTTVSAISDQRLKENIRDLDYGLDAVMQLKPRKFDWKEGKGKDKKDDRGFIAQEFEQVFPDLIDEWKDPAPEGEEPYKSVRQDLIPVLVKAIQEQQTLIESQQAQIDALSARLDALENPTA